MERKHKEILAVMITAVSFVLLLAFIPILCMCGTSSVMVAPSLLIILVIVWIGGMIAAIEYSDSGWTIEGSTLEWIIAAMLAPGMTLLVFLTNRDQKEGEAIDPNDYELIRRL